MKQNDPQALVDFRTPRFDLDCVYGRGPDDQPYLYEADGRHLQLGRPLTGNPNDANTRDVTRHASQSGSGQQRSRALIGDPRNDENVIVSQLQGVMLRLHNRLADEHPHRNFPSLQRLVRWHYQWVVVYDFLPTIVGEDMVHSILPHLASGQSILKDKLDLGFYKFQKNPFIPIEFSAAAYRFGHSMVRPIYRLNIMLGQDPPRQNDAANGRQFIFGPNDDETVLNGFREFPSIRRLNGACSSISAISCRTSASSVSSAPIRSTRRSSTHSVSFHRRSGLRAMSAPSRSEVCFAASGWDRRPAKKSRERWAKWRSRTRC